MKDQQKTTHKKHEWTLCVYFDAEMCETISKLSDFVENDVKLPVAYHRILVILPSKWRWFVGKITVIYRQNDVNLPLKWRHFTVRMAVISR